MAYVAVGVAVASAAYSVYSSQQQASAMEDKANFDREMSKLNAERAEVDAAQVVRDGESEKLKYKGQADRVNAQQEETLATQDINPTKGAVADVLAESKLNAHLNTIDIGYNAFMNSSKFKREASMTRAQGEVDYMAGNVNANNTRLSGYASAINTLGNAAINKSGKKDK